MRSTSISLFIILFTSATALPATKITYEDINCAETLTHFTTFDTSVEKPLEDIFEKHAFEILPLGMKQIDQARLDHFYGLVRDQIHRADSFSHEMSQWIHLEKVLGADLNERFVEASPASILIRQTLQALVVTAVAADLLPHVQNQETQYKLVFAALTFSQRTVPPKWKVRFWEFREPATRRFILKMSLTHYPLYYFLQKGPWNGRQEVLRHELSHIKLRALDALQKHPIDNRLRPYLEGIFGPLAADLKYIN